MKQENHRHRKDERRQDLKEFGDAHENAVDPAAIEAGERADGHAERHGQQCCAQSDGETGAAAVDDARKQVAAEIVRPEQHAVFAGRQQRRGDDIEWIGAVDERAGDRHGDDESEQYEAEHSGAIAPEHDPGFGERPMGGERRRGFAHREPIRGSIAR